MLDCVEEKSLYKWNCVFHEKNTHTAIGLSSPHILLKLSPTSLLHWAQNNQVNLVFWEQVVPHPVTRRLFLNFFGGKYKESSRIIQLLMPKVGLQD